MDKWVRNIHSVFLDSLMRDNSYRFSYSNSSGDVLHVFSDRVIIKTAKGDIEIAYKDIAAVDMSTPYKGDQDNRAITFSYENKSANFIVDTSTSGELDLPHIWAQLRRLVVSSRGNSAGT